MTSKVKFKPGSFLIPARNPRHRTACLALYRALLRCAPKVALPDELSTGWGVGRNPIKIQIRGAFERNKSDVSPRILWPAMNAGYRMISVLRDAIETPNSSHHTEILSFLRSRLAERQRSLANRPDLSTPKENLSIPRPGHLPLLVDVTPAPTPKNPNPKPEYATPHRPRPQSELGGTGRRKIPHIDMAGDLAFMRLTKPQPKRLSIILSWKGKRRLDRMQRATELRTDDLEAAKIEDQWDTAIEKLEARQRGSDKNKIKMNNSNSNSNNNIITFDEHNRNNELQKSQSHAGVVLRGFNELNKILTLERTHQVARADAMRRLIKQEKTLAEQEKVQRAKDKRARWEARMQELHGDGWRSLFPNLDSN